MSWVDFLKIKCTGWKISEHLLSEGGGAPIPDSRVDHSLTNLGFNEHPHLTNQNLFPMEIGEYGPPFNLINYIVIPFGFVKSGCMLISLKLR